MLTKVLFMIFLVTLSACTTNKNEIVNPAEPDSMTTAGGCTGIACPVGGETSAITH